MLFIKFEVETVILEEGYREISKKYKIFFEINVIN